jgi:RNA polymerase sigma factor FliA
MAEKTRQSAAKPASQASSIPVRADAPSVTHKEVGTITLKDPANPATKPHKSVPMDDNVLQLWRQYKANPAPGPLRDKVILHYLHLVRYVVNRLPVTLPVTVGPDDLLSYGTLGLIEAVQRFDVERGLKFETYALTRIRGAIIDQLRVQDWIPRGVRKRSKQLQDAMAKLEERLGRNPTEEELATELAVPPAKVRQMVSDTNNLMLSLDESWSSDEGQGNSLIDLIEDQRSPDPESQYETNELRDRLTQAINSLPEREKLLIALYYHENMTLKEIGEIIQVSESRVCQLHAQAILRLRNKLNQG